MARWDRLLDRSNPFNRDGLSAEVTSMLDYLEAASRVTGIDVAVTSTTDHPKFSASGNVSRHRQPGTGGEGLGIDGRSRTRGRNIHSAAYGLVLPFAAISAELIYAEGPSFKRGKEYRYSAPVMEDHEDHLHWAVDKGVLIPPYHHTHIEEDPMQVVVQRPQGGAIVVAPDGGVFAIGGAPYLRSLPEDNIRPNAPISGGAWTPTGQGYWLVGADGGIFAFGDAPAIDPRPVLPHIGSRPVVGVVCIDARTLELVAFDRSNDGSPYDAYRVSA